MTHPLIVLIIALIAGYSAFSYAKAKIDYTNAKRCGLLAFLVPISLPLVTLYLIGKPLPQNTQTKPVVIVMLTIGNMLAVILAIVLLAGLGQR